MKRTWIRSAGAFVAAIALIALFYAPGQTGAEENKRPDRTDLSMELGRTFNSYYLLQFSEAQRDISLLAAAMRAKPDRFDAKTHALLDECGKLWARGDLWYDRAATFLKDPQFPANDQQIADFRAIVQKLADDGYTLSHVKLDELLRAASNDEWERWEAEAREEVEAELSKHDPPKDDDEKK